MQTPKITACLWMDSEAEEAAKFYTAAFKNARMLETTYYGKAGKEMHHKKEGSVMSVAFSLENMEFVCLNGGPLFKINPSISFFVVCETEHETDLLWKKLLDGGKILMPLEKQEWSDKYGWLQDKFGLTWQISLGQLSEVGQKITPSLLFVNEQYGRAKDAIAFYTSVFRNTGITGILEHGEGNHEQPGTVQHAQFKLEGETFMAMDSNAGHDFNFNEAVSLMIHCQTQEEIDYYWEKLTPGGDPKAQQCGWLKDKFGVSWQVYADVLRDLLQHPDKQKRERVTEAFMQMKKFDIAKLEEAYNGRNSALGAQ